MEDTREKFKKSLSLKNVDKGAPGSPEGKTKVFRVASKDEVNTANTTNSVNTVKLNTTPGSTTPTKGNDVGGTVDDTAVSQQHRMPNKSKNTSKKSLFTSKSFLGRSGKEGGDDGTASGSRSANQSGSTSPSIRMPTGGYSPGGHPIRAKLSSSGRKDVFGKGRVEDSPTMNLVRSSSASSNASDGDLEDAEYTEVPETESYFLRAKARKEIVEEPAYMAYLPPGVNWMTDLFCILHNGIRRELHDMYYIMASFQKRKFFLHSDDIEKFFDWFVAVPWFIKMIHDIKEETIYKMLVSKGMNEDRDLPTGLQAKNRKVRYTYLIKKMNNMDEKDKCANTRPPGERMEMLKQDIADIFPALFALMHEEEANVPPLLGQFYDEDIMPELMKDIVTFIENTEDPHLLFIMMTRWLTLKDPMYLKWRTVYLDRGNLVTHTKYIKQWQAARRNFKSTRSAQVGEFFKLWNQFEMEGMMTAPNSFNAATQA